MKNLFTLLAVLVFGAQLTAQIFHKKYNYSNEIMLGQTSVVNNNRIYTAASSNMMQGSFSIQKTDLAGNHIATQRVMLGTSTPPVMVRKIVTMGSKLYVIGNVNPGTITDGLLVVLDTNLTSVSYIYSYGTSANNEDFYDATFTANNELVMVGHSTVPTSTVGVYKYLPFVTRVNPLSGNAIYERIYEDNLSKYCYSVVEDPGTNDLIISGTVQGTNATHLLKIAGDNFGTFVAAKNMYFSSVGMNVKKLQVYGTKLFLIGGDPNNNLMTVETDLSLNSIIMPKYYTNFKYWDHIKVGSVNYIAGLSAPTGTTSYLSALKMDSVFNPQVATSYTLVPVPSIVNTSGVNVVNNSNRMFWVAYEAWTAPAPYTNRYIVASDMFLNATCNGSYSLTPANNINTIGMTTFTNPPSSYTVQSHISTPSSLTPTVTTLCSSTGIENVNENFEKFKIKTGFDKISIESPYSDYTICLFDISGKIVLNETLNSEFEEISTSNLPSGIYIIKMIAKGFEQREKIIKQ